MASMPEFTRLLAIALLNYCDDEGYFLSDPKSIRGAVFPFMDDSRKIQGALTELSKHSFVKLGKLPDGRDVGHVVNFLNHQVINRPQSSRIKELAIFTEDSVNAHGALTAGMEGNGMGKRNKEGRGRGTLEEVVSFVSELGLPASDGESCFHKWEGNDWTNGGKKIADWKATIRSWKAAGYMASQKKAEMATPGQRPKNIYQGETVK